MPGGYLTWPGSRHVADGGGPKSTASSAPVDGSDQPALRSPGNGHSRGAYRMRRADPVDLGWPGRGGSSSGLGCSHSAGPDGWLGTLGMPRNWYPAASARTSTPMTT